MKTNTLAAAAFAATGLGTPALAFEEVTFGDFKFTPEFGVNLTAEKASGKASESNAYAYLDATLVWSRKFGALTFGAEAYAAIEFDNDADGRNLYVTDDPYVDLGVWLEGERFGYLAYSYTSSAIGEHCVEPSAASDNYGHDEFVELGTCPSHDSRSVLYYRTPNLGQGVKLAVSYMPETSFETVDKDEAAESASLALLWEHKDASGATWSGSLGVEKVLKMQAGTVKPTSWQAGLGWARDGWELGGAAALTRNGDGTTDRALSFAVLREVTGKLDVSLGVNSSRSRAEAANLDEGSISLLATYSFVPDKVIVDAGLWHVETDKAGVSSANDIVAVSLYF